MGYQGSPRVNRRDLPHRTDQPPTKERYQARPWQKPHKQNLTGTAMAYRPDGSLLNNRERPRVTGDYDAWSPE